MQRAFIWGEKRHAISKAQRQVTHWGKNISNLHERKKSKVYKESLLYEKKKTTHLKMDLNLMFTK